MNEWYVQANQQQYGPVSQEVLCDWIAQGRIGPSSLVWRPGLTQWAPAQTHFLFSTGDIAPSPATATVMPAQGPPAWGPPVYGIAAPVMRRKCGKVQAIAIMSLVCGILDCVWGLCLLLSCYGAMLGAYAIVVGIMAIVYASKLLPEPNSVARPAKHVAVMQIVNIVSLSFWSLVIGILCLVFYNDPEVQDYFGGKQSGA